MSKLANSVKEGELILGIDPALGTTGYGVVRQHAGGLEVVDAGIVRCKRNAPLENRLLELSCGIAEIVEEHHPDCFAVEDLYSHYERPTTAILMGHARGVILLEAGKAGLSVHSYAATQIKKTLTGNGRAPKNQMQFAVQHQLGLKQLPEPADVADALAVAVTHCHLRSADSQLGPHLKQDSPYAALIKSQQAR